MDNFELAKKRGLSSVTARGFMPYSQDKDGNISVDFERAAKSIANDAAMTTPTGVGVPSLFTTYIDPNVVSILFAAQNATQIFEEQKRGSWTDKFYTFPVEEIVGKTTPYSDHTGNTTSDANYSFPTREGYLFETTIQYGDLESATAAVAKLDMVSAKQRAAATTLATAHNRFYLFGVAGKQIYGLLNDPNLPSSIAPISVNGKSTWADKIADKPMETANIIYNDINKLWGNLAANNGGLINQNDRLVLAISNTIVHYLSTPNEHGLTAITMLKTSFPNLTIVQLPELSTSAGEQIMLIAPAIRGQETGLMGYSEKMKMGRVVPELSSYKQKCVGGTWGFVLKQPSAIASMLGV